MSLLERSPTQFSPTVVCDYCSVAATDDESSVKMIRVQLGLNGDGETAPVRHACSEEHAILVASNRLRELIARGQ